MWSHGQRSATSLPMNGSEDLLDEIPTSPLCATGLAMLKGVTIYAVVYDSDIDKLRPAGREFKRLYAGCRSPHRVGCSETCRRFARRSSRPFVSKVSTKLSTTVVAIFKRTVPRVLTPSRRTSTPANTRFSVFTDAT